MRSRCRFHWFRGFRGDADEWNDPRGKVEGFDGNAYALQSPGIDGGPFLDVIAIFNADRRYFRIIKY